MSSHQLFWFNSVIRGFDCDWTNSIGHCLRNFQVCWEFGKWRLLFPFVEFLYKSLTSSNVVPRCEDSEICKNNCESSNSCKDDRTVNHLQTKPNNRHYQSKQNGTGPNQTKLPCWTSAAIRDRSETFQSSKLALNVIFFTEKVRKLRVKTETGNLSKFSVVVWNECWACSQGFLGTKTAIFTH